MIDGLGSALLRVSLTCGFVLGACVVALTAAVYHDLAAEKAGTPEKKIRRIYMTILEATASGASIIGLIALVAAMTAKIWGF